MARIVNWYGRLIHLDEDYYLYFSDVRREKLTDEQQAQQEEREKEYGFIRSLPEKLMYRQLAEMDPRLNPKVTVLKGHELIAISSEGKYIPQFDAFFDKTRRLVLIPLDGIEFMREMRDQME